MTGFWDFAQNNEAVPLKGTYKQTLIIIAPMNVISKKTLIEFYTKNTQAKIPLEIWHSNARKAIWSSPEDIKRECKSASFLKDNRVVFNIKGNDFRLIVHIDYPRKIVRVKFVGTHAEYDKIKPEEI